MPRILLLLALVLAVFFLVSYLRQLPPQKRRRTTITLIITLLSLAAVVLTVTGRMHWIGAALTAVLVALRQFGPALLKLFPVFQSLHRQRQREQSGNPPPQKPNNTMSRQDALAVLGLSDPASDDDIIAAHRSLMQKLHPDRGGNDYLAAQINQAKDTLLG